MSKTSTVLAVLLGMAIVGLRAAPADPAKPDVSKLVADRLDAARNVYKGLQTSYSQGLAPLSDLVAWAPHLLDAQLEAGNPTQAFADYVALMQVMEKQTKTAYDSGRINASDLDRVRFFRLEAELWQARGHK
jgi:hypothetical protein